jgi:hypothetical protein
VKNSLRFWRFVRLLLVVLPIGACSNDTLPKYQLLGDFRVLGIQANTPEVSVASLPATVTLTPILSDVGSGGRTITITGAACPDPGVSFGAEPTCDQSAQRVDLTIAPVSPGASAANSQIFGTPSLTGATPGFTVTVPAGITNGRSVADNFNGVGYLISLRFQAGDRVVRAYKRIVVSNKPTLNVNPSLNAVLANGTALTMLPAATVNLSVQATGQGTYQIMDAGGGIQSRSEVLRVTFFNSDGVLNRSRVSVGEDNKWDLSSAAPVGRPTTIVAIVYDGLGGMAFRIVDL